MSYLDAQRVDRRGVAQEWRAFRCDFCGEELPFSSLSAADRDGWDWFSHADGRVVHACTRCLASVSADVECVRSDAAQSWRERRAAIARETKGGTDEPR